MQNRTRWSALLALTVFYPTLALGSGFYVARFGGSHGHGATDNVTAVYYNPAGLALGADTRLHIEGIFAWREFTYDRPADAISKVIGPNDRGVGTPEEFVTGDCTQSNHCPNHGKATLSNTLASPFIGLATDFGVEGLGVGLAVFGPLGGKSVFDRQSARASDEVLTGAADGPQRWWSIEGTIQSAYIAASVAYHLKDYNLAIGLSLNAVLSTVDTVRAKTSPNNDNIVNRVPVTGLNGEESYVDRPYEGRSYVQNASALEPALGLGVMYMPIPEVRVGVSYQSSPNFGASVLEGDSYILFGETEFDNPERQESRPKVKVYQHMPDVFNWGIVFQPDPTYALRVFGNYVLWSRFTEQCVSKDIPSAIDGSALSDSGVCNTNDERNLIAITRNWDDGYNIRLAGSYWPLAELELIGDLGYDSNAVPDEYLEPALFDTTKYTLGLGAHYEVVSRLRLGLMYTQVFYDDRTVESGVSRSEPNSAGTYTQAIGVTNVSVEYSFSAF